MGVYSAAVVTNGGQNLIAQALASEKPLTFTSAKTSNCLYPEGTDILALTDLQDVVQTAVPSASKVLSGNLMQISVRFDNYAINQAYRIETIGLYAKIEGGVETLFSVTRAITPDEMPEQSDISPSAYIYNIQHSVQNVSQITLTVNPAGTVSVQDILSIEEDIAKLWEKTGKILRDVIVTVPTTWTGETAPYTQIISVPDIKVGDPAELWSAVTADTSVADVKTWTKMAAMINAAEISADGKLTLICRLKKPTAEFKIRLKGVSGT